MLAVMEANRAGYDEALLLTEDGYVADGSGENLFVVKDGVIARRTSPRRSCLGSRATRSSRSRRTSVHGRGEAPDPNRSLRRRRGLHDRNGRGGHADPEIDDVEIGDPGPVTREIQRAYLETVCGTREQWAHSLDRVPNFSVATG